MSQANMYLIHDWRGYLLCLALSLCLGLPAHAQTGPQQVVEQTTDKMLAKLKQQREALKKNPDLIYGMVSEIVLPHFDFITMSRWVLGKYWRRASKEQKLRFVKAFRTLMVRTYAVALLEYTDQTIHFLPLRDDPARGDVTVRSEVRQTSKPGISINYNLHKRREDWKVYDVSVDGVSLLLTYRTSFTTEIGQTSLDALIQRLEKHNLKAGQASS